MRFAPYLVLLAAHFLWAGNWIVARAVRDEIPPAIATMTRQLVVLAVLAPFAFASLRTKLKDFGARDWRMLVALAFFGGGLHLSLQWLGLHYTTATSATLYLSISPIFILLLARPLLGEAISAPQWLGVLISLPGVVLIATRGDPSGFSFNPGDLLALAAMVMWAAYTVFLRLRRDTLDTVEFLVMLCLFGLLFMGPWVLWEILNQANLRPTPAGALAVLYSAIGSMLLAYTGWNYAVKRLGAARVGVTMHLTTAIAVLLAALFLGEYPGWYHGAGIALILAGVALSSFRASSAASSR